MPPKKIMKIGNMSIDPNNPRVILHPLRASSTGQSLNRYRLSTSPPTASLFKKPELSDIKLKVGDQTYYAHRLILCAGSDVFARMLGSDWKESSSAELELQEEEACVKVFERFLYYFYTGSLVISENYVIPLFMLADKYNVKAVYDECVKHIETGLKVFVITKNPLSRTSNKDSNTVAGASSYKAAESFMMSSSSSCTDSSDSDSSETGQSTMPHLLPAASPVPTSKSSSPSGGSSQTTHLVASETFPLALVMKMLLYCQNERIYSAALYNLEARLTKHIMHENYALWNDLDKDLLVQILSDDNFYCNEHVLFRAAKSWLEYQTERQTTAIMSEVLGCIRYPLLEADALYDVERDVIVKRCNAQKLVQEAIRYKLFQNCARAAEQEKWEGHQFTARQIKDF